MSNTANPFEPPRSDDRGGPAPAAAGTDVLPEEALNALIETAPWARWSVRLTLVSALLTAIYTMVTVGSSTQKAQVVMAVVSAAFALVFSLLWVMFTGRYASHASRLQFREHRAVVGVIEAQRGLFRMMGILVILSVVLMIVGLVIGFTMGRAMGPR